MAGDRLAGGVHEVEWHKFIINMDLATGVSSDLVTHADETGSDSFMLSVSMDDEDEHGLHSSDIARAGWLIHLSK